MLGEYEMICLSLKTIGSQIAAIDRQLHRISKGWRSSEKTEAQLVKRRDTLMKYRDEMLLKQKLLDAQG